MTKKDIGRLINNLIVPKFHCQGYHGKMEELFECKDCMSALEPSPIIRFRWFLVRINNKLFNIK